ncbi:DUF7855 family protein [Halomarina litorea]|uniref:DUF7855 family protein n=1 Tax=Halomarina litorea TaxID=2961595 RepID=UPI0020C416D8|nr:hypothetical protein [Halomarina sp. BCD28]
MLLVVAYSRAARATLRNVHAAHEASVVRRFGRVALFEATELGAFLALRLREKHPGEVQVDRVRPFNEFESVPDPVREAARAYEARETPSTPYSKFAAGTDHPSADAMAGRDL